MRFLRPELVGVVGKKLNKIAGALSINSNYKF